MSDSHSVPWIKRLHDRLWEINRATLRYEMAASVGGKEGETVWHEGEEMLPGVQSLQEAISTATPELLRQLIDE